MSYFPLDWQDDDESLSSDIDIIEPEDGTVPFEELEFLDVEELEAEGIDMDWLIGQQLEPEEPDEFDLLPTEQVCTSCWMAVHKSQLNPNGVCIECDPWQ